MVVEAGGITVGMWLAACVDLWLGGIFCTRMGGNKGPFFCVRLRGCIGEL
ncbi:hypothetical protein ABID23_000968 [Bartonella silvatica]|uniref:Uncharacterized protein n=1 Tax=Bartonella silvatica TaxID=357760 RepID=A0ABV2HH89_9HYPH